MLPPPHLSFLGQKPPPHPCFVLRRKGLSHCEEASSSQLPVGRNPQRACPLLFGRLLGAGGVMVWSRGAETGSCHALSLVWRPACVQELTAPGEPRAHHTASFAPVSPGGTLLSAGTIERGCAGGSPCLGNRVLRFMQINPCLSAKSALFPCLKQF